MRRRRTSISKLPARGEELVISTGDATTMQALDVIRRVAKLSAEEPEIIHIAQCFANYSNNWELANNLANFAYKSAYFEPDTNDNQRVKSSVRILRDGKTNCVGYSTLISSILTVLGVPHTLRLVDTNGKGFSHIYPILDGIVMDVVPQQDQHGNEQNLRINGNDAKVGEEIAYKRKYDLLITPTQ